MEALSFNSRCDALGEFIGVHLLINDADDQRGALHRDDQGRKPRGDAAALRALMAEADVVLAVGTEFGPTDYDMYADGGFVLPPTLIRVDIDQAMAVMHEVAATMRASAAFAGRILDAYLPGVAARPGLPRQAVGVAAHGVRPDAGRAERALTSSGRAPHWRGPGLFRFPDAFGAHTRWLTGAKN